MARKIIVEAVLRNNVGDIIYSDEVKPSIVNPGYYILEMVDLAVGDMITIQERETEVE